MAQVPVYNQNGKAVGQATIAERIAVPAPSEAPTNCARVGSPGASRIRR